MPHFSEALRGRLPGHHRHFMDVIETGLGQWIERHGRFEQLPHAAARDISGTGQQSAAALLTSQATNLAARIVGLTEGFIDLVNLDRTYAAPRSSEHCTRRRAFRATSRTILSQGSGRERLTTFSDSSFVSGSGPDQAQAMGTYGQSAYQHSTRLPTSGSTPICGNLVRAKTVRA
jgi:hypothetical protein